LVLILVSLSQLSLLIVAAYVALMEARTGDLLVYYLIALPSFIAMLTIIGGVVLAVIVPMRFRMDPNANQGSNLNVDGEE